MRAEFLERLQATLGDSIPVDQYLAGWQETLAQLVGNGVPEQDIERVILEAASLKLSPCVGQIAVVSYNTRRGPVVRAMITARGMLTLMMRASDVADVDVQLVHKSDTYRLVNGEFIHEYDPFDEAREIKGPEDIKGGYLKVTYRDGRVKYHFVTVSKIEKMRACAERQVIWNTWYREMAMKSVIREAFARQVITIDPLVQMALSKVISQDDDVLANTPEPKYSNGTTNGSADSDNPAGQGTDYAERIANAKTIQDLSAIANEIAKSTIDRETRSALRQLWSAKLAAIKNGASQ